jgi:cytochrome b pre-mRNA-processing protein 3
LLYGSIVTQARSPAFYASWHLPDTREGRFEAIALHLVLVLRRLGTEGEPTQDLRTALTEVFATDLDDGLREMTIGDLAVPREVKRAVAVLHDRYTTYGAGLAAGAAPAGLEQAVGSRLATLEGAEGLDAPRFCAYIREAAHVLEQQPARQLLSGQIAWPRIRAPGE